MIGLLLILSLGQRTAGGRELLSPERVQQSVLKNFPLIEEAVRKTDASRERLRSTRGQFDTKLKFKAANRLESSYEKHIENVFGKNPARAGHHAVCRPPARPRQYPGYTGKYQTSAGGEAFAGVSVPLLRNRGRRRECAWTAISRKSTCRSPISNCA